MEAPRLFVGISTSNGDSYEQSRHLLLEAPGLFVRIPTNNRGASIRRFCIVFHISRTHSFSTARTYSFRQNFFSGLPQLFGEAEKGFAPGGASIVRWDSNEESRYLLLEVLQLLVGIPTNNQGTSRCPFSAPPNS